MMKITREGLRPYLFISLAFCVMALLTYYPLGYGFYVSFTDMNKTTFATRGKDGTLHDLVAMSVIYTLPSSPPVTMVIYPTSVTDATDGPRALSPTEIDKLTKSDDDSYVSSGWEEDYSDSKYVEFLFLSTIPSEATIDNVILVFEGQEEAGIIATRARVWDNDISGWRDFDISWVVIVDQKVNVDLSDFINSPAKVNVLRIWFQAKYYTYKFVGLKNYSDTLRSPYFWTLLGRTTLWTVGCVAPHVIGGLCLALLLNRKWRFRGAYRTIYLLPWAVPSWISCLMWKGMFNANPDYGVINRFSGLSVDWLSTMPWAFVAVIITNIWLGIPFMTIMHSAALQKIPKDLYDAADVDGATGWQKLRHITLPLLKPTIVFASLIGFIWTFNLFHVIYFMTGGGPFSIVGGMKLGSTEILITRAFNDFNIGRYDKITDTYVGQMGTAAALSVIIFFILLLISIVYLKVSKVLEV